MSRAGFVWAAAVWMVAGAGWGWADDESPGVEAPDGRVLARVPGLPGDSAVRYHESGGATYLRATDIAGFLKATTYWRPETRKFLLRRGATRLRVGIDNPVCVAGDDTYAIPPPFYRDGDVWLPIEFLEVCALAGLSAPVSWDRQGRVLEWGSGKETVTALGFDELEGATRLTVDLSRAVRPQVVSARRQAFLVRLPGATVRPSLAGDVQAMGRFASVSLEETPSGVDLHMQVPEAARGYSLRFLSDPQRLELVVADEWGRQGDEAYQPFAGDVARNPSVARRRRSQGPPLVVLDPGHGGEDSGARSASGKAEKHLTLELARRLKRALEAQGVRVELARQRDERVDVVRRVEMANGLNADLFLTLHLDLNGPLSRRGFLAAIRGGRGVVEYEDLTPQAELAAAGPSRALGLARWESAGRGFEHGSLRAASRIARRLREAFPDAWGRIVSRPVWNLEGARMPAVFLELGALGGTGSDAGARLASGEVMNRTANAIGQALGDLLGASSRAKGD